MKILAIDSSTTPASVAITEDASPIGEFTININRTHSEKLLPLVDALLDATGLSVSDMDAFAISIGPGSFTGLRIGMSAAKLMAQTTGKPLIGVKTLEALAKNVSVFNGYCCPMLDARNNTVYTALYKCANGACEEIMPADALRIDDCISKLNALDLPVIICGEYSKYHDMLLAATNNVNVLFAPVHVASQRAVSCAVLAYEQYKKGQITSPEDIIPLYVRESQAEQSKKAKEAHKK